MYHSVSSMLNHTLLLLLLCLHYPLALLVCLYLQFHAIKKAADSIYGQLLVLYFVFFSGIILRIMNILKKGLAFHIFISIMAILKNHIENQIDWCYIRDRKSTHSKVDATQEGYMSLWTPPILCVRQDRHFYFRLFLLSRKVSNAMSKPPKDISNANIPRKTIMVS